APARGHARTPGERVRPPQCRPHAEARRPAFIAHARQFREIQMSQRKFASITGSLLVRKGDAGPSPAPQRTAPRDTLANGWAEPQPTAPLAPQPHDMGAGLAHRLTLRVDADRFRRLSIAAAQLQTPMQHLLMAALDSHLAARA